ASSVLAIGANLTSAGVLEEPDWNHSENVAVLRGWADANWSSDGEIDSSLLSPTPDEAAATADLLELMLLEPHIPAESLGTISCPTTVMVGEYDCIRDDETVAIWRSIPRARLSVVPECGHSIPKRRPDMVVYELLRLLED
ncbi:MAG: alpha/beta hydrolase, partial [Coriobacteriaceae bacterium]|nr:alpha/beta hydrolase [Coriobacteriaceae bacterium]